MQLQISFSCYWVISWEQLINEYGLYISYIYTSPRPSTKKQENDKRHTVDQTPKMYRPKPFRVCAL